MWLGCLGFLRSGWVGTLLSGLRQLRLIGEVGLAVGYYLSL